MWQCTCSGNGHKPIQRHWTLGTSKLVYVFQRIQYDLIMQSSNPTTLCAVQIEALLQLSIHVLNKLRWLWIVYNCYKNFYLFIVILFCITGVSGESWGYLHIRRAASNACIYSYCSDLLCRHPHTPLGHSGEPAGTINRFQKCKACDLSTF